MFCQKRTFKAKKTDIGTEKADIQGEKADIGTEKTDIQSKLLNIDAAITKKTLGHILTLYDECGNNEVFGRPVVEKVTGLKSTRASELIKLLMDNSIIEAVKGYGKGKYKFKR